MLKTAAETTKLTLELPTHVLDILDGWAAVSIR
jgi:hypothetical protein